MLMNRIGVPDVPLKVFFQLTFSYCFLRFSFQLVQLLMRLTKASVRPGIFYLPRQVKGVPRSVSVKDLFYVTGKSKDCHFSIRKINDLLLLIRKNNNFSLFSTKK